MIPFGEREYRIETYDLADEPGEAGRWSHHADVRGTCEAVRVIQALRDRGYSDMSISVERTHPDPYAEEE